MEIPLKCEAITNKNSCFLKKYKMVIQIVDGMDNIVQIKDVQQQIKQ